MGSGASSSRAKPSQSQNAPRSSDNIVQSQNKAASRPNLPSLETTFCDKQGKESVVTFYKKPLGFEICIGTAPIRVENVFNDGLAIKSGVQMGWSLIKVNGIDLSGRSFSEQFALLKAAMENLPFSIAHDVRPRIQSLEIIFEDCSDNKLVPVTFAKKPLGIEFDVVAPITVKNIKEDCVARRSGVEVGWVVKAVDGTDLSTMHVNDQVDLLKKCVRGLPDVTYSIAPPLSSSLSGDISTRNADSYSLDMDLHATLDDGRL